MVDGILTSESSTISQLTGEQIVLLVADRPNVSESEQDVLLAEHTGLAQPQPSPLFRTSRGMNIEPSAAAGIGKRLVSHCPVSTDRVWNEREQEQSENCKRTGGSLAKCWVFSDRTGQLNFCNWESAPT